MSENERYNRQLLIPGWDQQKLRESTICIWGLGALGSYVSVTLALQGVGHLILVDYDSVEISNLNRQLLFQKNDIGKNKAIIAKEKLERLNPDIKITAFPQRLEQISKSIYKNVDLFIAGLDSFQARRWANSLAYEMKKPLISGGMFAYLGDIQVIIPDETPCFECQPLIPANKLAQACSPLGEERQDERELEDLGKPLEDEQPIPSVATMSAIIGGWMAQEASKLLFHIGEPIKNYLFYDGLSNSVTMLELKKNPNCPVCGENYKAKKVKLVIEKHEPVETIMQRLRLTYGLKEPQLIFKGRFVSSDKTPSDLGIHENDLVLIIDSNLATPIQLRVEFSS